VGSTGVVQGRASPSYCVLRSDHEVLMRLSDCSYLAMPRSQGLANSRRIWASCQQGPRISSAKRLREHVSINPHGHVDSYTGGSIALYLASERLVSIRPLMVASQFLSYSPQINQASPIPR
jgi:hypothetical protein